VAYWGQRTLNDTERYVETVTPLIESPEVQDVLATQVTTVIEQQVDIEATLNDVFAEVISDRPRLELLVRPLAGAINGLIDRQVRAFIASDEFADIWVRVNTRSQQALLRVLTGDLSGAISLQGDSVVIDLDEVIATVQDRLVERGLTVAEQIPVPETDRQIVIVEESKVRQVRTIYAFSNPVARWLLPLVGVLYLGAFVLARRRARMAVTIGILIAVNALLLALLLSVGRQLFIDSAAGTLFAPASPVFYDTLFAFLKRGQQVLLALGIVLAVLGWFAGRSRYSDAVRSSVSGALERVGGAVREPHVDATGRWVAGNAGWLRVVVGALGFVVLLWGNDVSMSRLWWSLGLVLVLLALIQVMVGAGRTDRDLSSSSAAATPDAG
jgi:hypothetical protein